jgi:hypothetical protein
VLEDLQDSILSDIATALVPITAAASETAQHFSYGARGFYARPSERSERLKLFVMSSCSSFFDKSRTVRSTHNLEAQEV